MPNPSSSPSIEQLRQIAHSLTDITNERLKEGPIASIISGIAEVLKPDSQSGLSRADERSIDRGVAIDTARETLEPFGFEVITPGSELDSGGTPIIAKSTGLVLVDSIAFVRFLSSVTESALIKSQLQEPLRDVLAQCHSGISGYCRAHPSDTELEVFDSVPDIVTHTSRLGYDSLARDMELAYERAKNGTLLYFLDVERKSLLKGPNDEAFGPHQWHLDATSEIFAKLWLDALDVLSNLFDAGELTSALASEVTQNLRFAIRTVPAEIDRLHEEQNYYRGFDGGSEKLVTQLKATLSYMSGEIDSLQSRAVSLDQNDFPSRDSP